MRRALDIPAVAAVVLLLVSCGDSPASPSSPPLGTATSSGPATSASAGACRDTPPPIVRLLAIERETLSGVTFDRYQVEVVNRQAYPAALFAAAPTLPPCGLNTAASRTWITVHGLVGGVSTYSHGFCGMLEPSHLTGMWFTVPVGSPAPSHLQVTMLDRACGTLYASRATPIDP